jgi:hypothetical protein
VILVSLLLLSCGYSTGRLLPSNIKKIYIPTFTNQTTKYGIEQELTSSVVEAFVKDNRLLVVSQDQADAILRGTIVKYEKGALTFDRAKDVDEVKIEIAVAVEFEDLRTGKILWRDEGMSSWSLYRQGGSTSAGEDTLATPHDEGAALEKIFHTLASDIVARTIEGW